MATLSAETKGKEDIICGHQRGWIVLKSKNILKLKCLLKIFLEPKAKQSGFLPTVKNLRKD